MAEDETAPADDTRTSIERAQHPGDINQALIELGSTVCRVREPDCASCPLRPWCNAYSTAVAKDDSPPVGRLYELTHFGS